MTIRYIGRWDNCDEVLRLVRIVWGKPALSRKLTVALRPKFVAMDDLANGWDVTLLGIRVHWARSRGGMFAA